MSSSTDKMTIKQNATYIKSQRQQRITANKSQQQFEEDNKDKQIIFEALDRIRDRCITNTKEFTWKIMYYENKYKNNKNDNNNYDEKENENKKIIKNHNISQLINTKYTQMCKFGHGEIWRNEKTRITDNKCIMCGSTNERQYCYDCVFYNADRAGAGQKDWKDFYPLHIYCKECRVNNARNIKNILKMNRFKALIIRNELLNNPSLEMDLLCNMPRKASVDWLINDINKLPPQKRSKWSVFLFDLDHLKCWNTCIGHIKTDLLIKKIGNVMKKYVNVINNGIWNNKEKGQLEQSYVYRTGGDEFVMAVKCGWSACDCKLGPFYWSIKKDINNIGLNIKELIFNNNENEWNEVKEQLNKAKDRNNNPINMNIVGISTGLFIPDSFANKEKDWLSLGDKIALEHAKTVNIPNKNAIAIYYEEIGGLIPDQKVLKCLEMGVDGALQQI